MREEALHALFRNAFPKRRGLTGPGDDCATLRPPKGSLLVQSVDQLVEGVHLLPTAGPSAMARKLLRRSLSDLAAAGAKPWAVQWTVAAPTEKGGAWMRALMHAFLNEAKVWDVPVIGGDLSTAPHVVLTCTVMGLARKAPVGRGGARSGDSIWVTGKLGGAVESGRHRLPHPRLAEGRRLLEKYTPHAMMDLSDGLLADLPRILRASEVGATVYGESVPCNTKASLSSAVAEGEDYELLVVLAPRQARRASSDALLQKVGWTEIGVIEKRKGLRWKLDGTLWKPQVKPWGHTW